MITEAQYTALTDVIKKSCPEIMELKPGCKVKVKIKDDWFTGDEIFTIAREEKEYTKATWSLIEGSTACFDGSCFEILGSPITLSHVLRTMREKRSHEFHQSDFVTTKRIAEKRTQEDIDIIWKHWDLETDDLSLASDETKMWLWNLLCNKGTV